MTPEANLSVIMPFFNEFTYLEESLGALLAAGDAVGEIIIVNDLPTDWNKQLLAHIDQIPKCRVIHNPSNMGASASRNHGLTYATCDYVMFHDADDMVAPNGLAEALRFGASERADMIHLPTWMYRPSDGIYDRHGRDVALFGRKVASTDVRRMPELRYGVANWTYIFRRAFMVEHDIKLDPEQRKTADHLLIVSALEKAERVTCSDQWVHIWRDRPNSLSRHRRGYVDYELHLGQFTKVLALLAGKYAVTDPDFQRDLAFSFMRILLRTDYIETCLADRDTSPEALRLLEAFARATEPYPLQPETLRDRSYRRVHNAKILGQHKLPLTDDLILRIFEALRGRNWAELDRIYALAAPAKTGGAKAKLPEYITLQEAGGRDGAAAQIVLHDPLTVIERAYRHRRDDSTIREQRSFGQFILDRIAADIAMADRVLSERFDSPDAVTLSLAASAGTEPDAALCPEPAAHSPLRDLIPLAPERPPQGWSALQQALDAIGEDIHGGAPIAPQLQAQCLAYVLKSLAPSVTLAPDAQIPAGLEPDLILIGVLAQALERETGGKTRECIALGQLARNDIVTAGDANYFGNRTLKSRVRFELRKIIPSFA